MQTALLIGMAHAVFVNCTFSEKKIAAIKHLNIQRMTEKRLVLEM